MSRLHRVVALGGFASLLILHLDFWRPQRSVLHFGWVPEELLYRVSWILLAWLYLLFLCGRLRVEGNGAETEGDNE